MIQTIFPLQMATYYFTYLAACAALIIWLARTFHRFGSIFLREAFRGDETIVAALTHLLDIGFYLMTIGYVTVTCRGTGFSSDYSWIFVTVAERLGGFLIYMGCLHLFNLLLLAIFRRRTLVTNSTPSTPISASSL
jgi:hypothetical protein